jgi:hypothetical protein
MPVHITALLFRSFLFRSLLVSASWAVLLSSTSAPVSAQWLKHPTAGIPRTADGKANLSAPAPKTPDGKPDLSGIWEAHEDLSPYGGYKAHFMDLALDLKPAEAPFQPWARALSLERQDNQHKDDPLNLCLPPGVPRINTIAPFKIVQTPQLVIVLYETTANSNFRQIFTDGRPLPKDPQPTWLGYSVGTWEGNVLKVDTIGFNDRGWIDTGMGHPQTEALHVTERFRRTDFGHLEIGITIDDPKAYTKPWTATMKVDLLPDTELLETTCENSKGLEHLVGK